jgi:probable rRNA maturation factor
VNVVLTSDREMRGLNRRFRSKHKPTDVLSFAPIAAVADQFAGDIVISTETAAANAQRLGHSLSQELKILVLHGMLHLAGYDHERDNGQMARKEERLRRQLGLSDGLIRRTGTQPSRGRTRRGTARGGTAAVPLTANRKAALTAEGKTDHHSRRRTA